MSVVVSQLEPQHETEWSAYVDGHTDGTFFHTLIWRDAVTQAFGHESVYLTAQRDGQIVGVFPLTIISSRLAGTLLVSVPYAVYGGTLADDEEAHLALLARAQKLARRLHANWIDIRSRTAQWSDLPVLERYVTFRKELPTDPAEVLAHLPRKARAAARQAREKYGLTASFDDADLPTVWALYSNNMRRVASPNYPTAFFRTLVEHTQVLEPGAADPNRPGHIVQVIRRGDQPIAGLLSFVYRGTLMPYFAGCDERFEKYHPNNFMYLTAMERGAELGCREFDFGRTRLDNEGPYNFKRFQGFEPTPLQYQYYVPAGGRAPDLHPGNPRLAIARRVWPKLPLAVTRPLGAWLAKSIPG